MCTKGISAQSAPPSPLATLRARTKDTLQAQFQLGSWAWGGRGVGREMAPGMPWDMCEDCGSTSRNFGYESDCKRRWCARCAKNHPGAVCRPKKKPPPGPPTLSGPGLHLLLPKGGTGPKTATGRRSAGRKSAGGRKAPHLATYLPAHLTDLTPGAKRARGGQKRQLGGSSPGGAKKMSANQMRRKDMCEDCGAVSKNYGYASDGKRRWCCQCALKHPGAVCRPSSAQPSGQKRAPKQHANDIVSRLKLLAQLRHSGDLSSDEFANAKALLLSPSPPQMMAPPPQPAAIPPQPPRDWAQ